MDGNHQYDFAIIGSGPGGYVCAIRAAQLGMKTVIIEKDKLGGICLNWGCIPTKALLKSADVFNEIKHASAYGIHVSSATFDLKAAVKRSRSVSAQLNQGIAHLMKKNKITVIKGTAKFIDKNTLQIDDQKKIQAKKIVIATGARPKKLDGIDFSSDRVWTYFEALEPTQKPTSIAIIGSGAIGSEFASFYADIGVNVNLIEMTDRIVPVEDQEVSKTLEKSFNNRGINIHTSSTLRNIKISKQKIDGEIFNLKNEKIKKISADYLLVAAGVVGNIEELNLEKIGIKTEKNQIIADEFCQTSIPNIYAIGDVAGAPMLAHKAEHEAIICAEHAAGEKTHTLNKKCIPGCTYTRPQIGSVGLTEEAVRKTNIDFSIGNFPLAANGKAIAAGETQGFVKIIIDKSSGELLGAHIIGHEATEIIHSLVVAKQAELIDVDLINSIFPHPTISEAVKEGVLSALNRTINF